MVYLVLLTFLASLLLPSQALPQASAESDRVSSTKKVKNWSAVPDPETEWDYALFRNPTEEGDLQTVDDDKTFADRRLEIAAAWSWYYRYEITEVDMEHRYEIQENAVFLDEYRGTELVRRFVYRNYLSLGMDNNFAEMVDSNTWEISITEPLPDGAITEELLESYERLATYSEIDRSYDLIECSMQRSEQLPSFEYELWVESAVTSDRKILQGSGWELMVGRKERDEIEGVWRPKTEDEATISPYNP